MLPYVFSCYIAVNAVLAGETSVNRAQRNNALTIFYLLHNVWEVHSKYCLLMNVAESYC